MTTLTTENIERLKSVIETCQLIGVDSALIESGKIIRGVNEDKTCLILSDSNVPDLLSDDAIIGLSRMSVLRSRLNVMAADDLVVKLEENNKGEIASIHLANKKSKTQFRCASPSIIRAPKAVNDTEKALIEIQKEDVTTISNAAKAMSAKSFMLVSKRNGENFEAFIEYYDANQDTFSIKVSDSIQFVDEASSFVHCYTSDVFLPLLRNIMSSLPEDEKIINLIIGTNGTLRLTVNTHTVILIPQVNTQNDD